MSPARARRGAALLMGLAALAAVGTGCAGPAAERPTVVVTTNILGDITGEIAGDEADVSVLMAPNADPHSFGLSAVQAAELEAADLVVYNGLGLEENVLRHVDAAREAGVPTLAVGDAVDPLTYREDGQAGQPDPHFWTDPDRVHRAAGLIAEQIGEHVTGVDTDAVRRNAEGYQGQVAELTAWMTESFEEIPQERRNLVTNHHVFGYLADRFGFEVVGAVIPSGTTLASPSAADLESLTRAMEEAQVSAVFADSSQPDRLAQVLREEMDTEIRVVPLYSESLTEEGGGAATYLAMMRANTEAITEGLTHG